MVSDHCFSAHSQVKTHKITLRMSNVVLIIRSSSHKDLAIHVQYYSKPNRAKKVCSLC
jgi:hypothetical protein